MALERHTFFGSPRQMGQQHGEALSAQIRALAEERLSMLLEGRPARTQDVVREAADQILTEAQLQVPDVLEETLGVADAAGLPAWKLVVSGGFTDVDHVVRSALGGGSDTGRWALQECTLFTIRGHDERLLLAGTWDSHASAQPGLALVERVPTLGPRTLALTTAGWPMQQGVSSAGIAFAIANLEPVASARGIAYIAALPYMAKAETLGGAVALLGSLRLCSGRYFLLIDSTGSSVGVETDGRQYWTSASPPAHTNHFVFPDAVAFEGRPEIIGESERRRKDADDLARRIPADPPSSLHQALLGSSTGIVSVAKSGSGREERTCSSFLLDPSAMSIAFTCGPPGQADWAVVSLPST